MLAFGIGTGLHLARRTCSSAIAAMNLGEVVKALNSIAPLHLAESWDNVGLLVEPSAPHHVKNIMLTNDLTIEVMEESIKSQVDLIVSYHPPIFRGLKRITQQSWKEQLVVSALENRIAIYSQHTASDAANGGVNDWLASGIGELRSVKPVKCLTKPASGGIFFLKSSNRDFPDHLEKDIEILAKTDSGVLAAWNGSRDMAHELSMVNVPSENVIQLSTLDHTMHKSGAGRICALERPLSIETIVRNLKQHLKVGNLRLALGRNECMRSEIRSVALCAGAGASVLSGCEADLYLTGEMSHHEVLDAAQNGTSVILCEHSNTERGYLRHLKTTLETQLSDVNVIVSEKDRDPLSVV